MKFPVPRPTNSGLTLFGAIAAVALIFSGCAAPPTAAPTGEDPNYDKAGRVNAVKVVQTARGVQITSDERVLFETGKSDIRSEANVFIDKVATILKTRTKANVLVEGHTDNVGSAVFNQQLSERRASAVRDALIKQGVPVSRIQSQGLGLTKPVADNTTPEGRQTNRRTEIIVLGETEANVAGPGGAKSLSDSLSEGLDRFLKNAGEFIKNVFNK